MAVAEALPLELAKQFATPGGSGQVPASPGPYEPSPSGSAGTCGSPWSPATPAVHMAGGVNAFGMPPASSPMASPCPSPQATPGRSPRRLVRFSGAVPAMPGKPTLHLVMPMVAQNAATSAASPSAATMSPVRATSGAVTATLSPVRRAGGCQKSPVTFAAMAMSPGAEIRHNAVTFGIPLNLTTSTSAPVPVRSAVGGVLAPSPTARVSGLPATAVAGSPFGAIPALPVPHSTSTRQPFTRPIATPLVGSLPRRAAGGA